MRLRSQILIILIHLGFISGYSQDYSKISFSFPQVYYGDVCWGDYNADGYLDIIITGDTGVFEKSPQSRIYKNTGDDTFIELDAGIIQVTQGSSDWGDIARHGDLDLLVTGYSAGTPVSRICATHMQNYC